MSGSDSEDFQTPKSYTNRRQYLVTYSKADLIKFPTRKSFCDALISCFNATGKVVAEYWACCLEEHENTSGYHYHASVRLSGPKRWNPVKKRLHEKFWHPSELLRIARKLLFSLQICMQKRPSCLQECGPS